MKYNVVAKNRISAISKARFRFPNRVVKGVIRAARISGLNVTKAFFIKTIARIRYRR
mgnify:CR=1 FL=1